jgi:hypothetical protein
MTASNQLEILVYVDIEPSTTVGVTLETCQALLAEQVRSLAAGIQSEYFTVEDAHLAPRPA